MGTIILKSTYAGKTSLDMSLIPVGEITITGSRCGPFEPALKLLKEGKVQFPAVELYNLKDFKEAVSASLFTFYSSTFLTFRFRRLPIHPHPTFPLWCSYV